MQIFRLTILNLKRMLQNKSVIIMTLTLPTIVICIMTFFTQGQNSSNNNMYIDFVNNDKGTLSGSLIKNFKNSGDFNINILDIADAKAQVESGAVNLTIVIPNNFTEQLNKGMVPKVDILKLQQGNSNVVAENIIDSFIKDNLISNTAISTIKDMNFNSKVSLSSLKDTIIKDTSENKINVMSSVLSYNNTNSLSGLITIGFVISFLMFSSIFIVNELIGEKVNGTLKRALSTPNSNITIAASIVISFLIIGWLQDFLIIITTKFLFNAYWGKSYLALFLLFTAILLVVQGLGLLISRVIKSENNISVITMLIVNISCLLGGSYMPIQYFPDILKKFALFMPQSWAVTALTDLVLKNKGITDILPNIGILLLFAIVFFTAGAASLRKIAE